MNSICLPMLALTASLTALILPLHAQDLVFKGNSAKASLIELYSSEGCSSCPPAETWLNDLKTAPGLWKDLFPVAFHVDYWDGLGWPDRFASAAFTQRQRDYAARLGQDSVYTPEFIVNGLEWRRGWVSDRIPGQATAGDLVLTLHAKDRKISARYSTGATTPDDVTLNFALLGFNLLTDVKRGENGGRTLRHDFVVLGFRSLPLVRGSDGTFQSSPIAIENSTGDQPGAVIAWVGPKDGTILQLAGGWLPAADKLTAPQPTSASALANP
jgi:hypothetical protein